MKFKKALNVFIIFGNGNFFLAFVNVFQH